VVKCLPSLHEALNSIPSTNIIKLSLHSDSSRHKIT
jgi:hypothetical protein